MLRSPLIQAFLAAWLGLAMAVVPPFVGSVPWPPEIPVPQFICHALDDGPDADRETTYGPTCWRIVETDGVIGAVLTERDADMLIWQSENYWMPTNADIEALEAGIIDAAEGTWISELEPDAVEWLAAGGHIRQYAGFVDDGSGDRKIHVTGDCRPVNEQWSSTVMLVNDGGACFFYGTFNVDRGEWEGFQFHGHA